MLAIPPANGIAHVSAKKLGSSFRIVSFSEWNCAILIANLRQFLRRGWAKFAEMLPVLRAFSEIDVVKNL
ncbi:MAG: hypothetical protein WA817_09295 [Candidatus Acidiferrum sp.]